MSSRQKRTIIKAAALAAAGAGLVGVLAARLTATEKAPEPAEHQAMEIHPPKDVQGEEIHVSAAREDKTPRQFIPKTEIAVQMEVLPEVQPEPEEEPPEETGPAMTYLGRRQVYGYDLRAECCGWTAGVTASGRAAAVGRTVASNELPFGTVIYIDGIGERIVEDRGGMTGGALDVLCADHSECYSITGVYDVYIVEAR